MDVLEKSTFAAKLLSWHSNVDRVLPWKADRNPYKIWLSEIIMQQTRVAQGTPYYLKFVDAYPTITDLANAPEDDIMRLWQGLGYYSRARNLHHAAKTVRDYYGGVFPREYSDVLALKGVGKYTAAAIVSFAYGDEYAVVDGNVIRVLSRYYGITDAVDSSQTVKLINDKAKSLIRNADPADYNQAIMDFGALHCTPKSPKCSECPFSSECIAFANDIISEIPYKAKKIKKRTRYLHYIIIEDIEANTIIRHRTEKDIWQSLYDYPCVEKDQKGQLSHDEIVQKVESLFVKSVSKVEYPSKEYKHILTHQLLYGQFYKVVVDTILTIPEPYKIIPQSAIMDYAMPVLLTNHLEDQKHSLF